MFQLHQEGETRHLVRVSTTITDASRNRIVGTALEKESPAYKALLRIDLMINLKTKQTERTPHLKGVCSVCLQR